MWGGKPLPGQSLHWQCRPSLRRLSGGQGSPGATAESSSYQPLGYTDSDNPCGVAGSSFHDFSAVLRSFLSPRQRATVQQRWTSRESSLDLDSFTQAGQTPKVATFLKASWAVKGHPVLEKTTYFRPKGQAEEVASLPSSALICSEDRRDGCVQAHGKGCTSGVSWSWILCLRNRLGLFCFWPPASGFFLCLLARVGLQKPLWEESGEG